MIMAANLFSIRTLLDWTRSNGNQDHAASLATGALSVTSLQEALPELRWEIYRARRYRRPLSLAVLDMEREEGEEDRADRTPQPSDGDGAPVLLETRIPHLASLLLGRILEGLVRQSDHVAHLPAQDRFALVLPETDRERAHRALARLTPLVKDRTGLPMRTGVASFPEDGFTLSDLLEEAEKRWRLPAPGSAEEPTSDARDGDGSAGLGTTGS